jgi:hypothetical protein
MPKTFYTERDIEDLAKRGVISLVVDDDVVLTDLARDKAMRLGIELERAVDQPPARRSDLISPRSPRPVLRNSRSMKASGLSVQNVHTSPSWFLPARKTGERKLSRLGVQGMMPSSSRCATKWLPAWATRLIPSSLRALSAVSCRTLALIKGLPCYSGACAARRSAPSSTPT